MVEFGKLFRFFILIPHQFHSQAPITNLIIIHTKTMKKSLITPIALLGLAAAVPNAMANLLVYEPFNYPAGVLTGQNGGIGFAAGWVASTGINQQGSVWNETTSTLFDGSTLNWNGALNNNFPKLPVVGARYAGATPSASSDLAISRTLATSAGAMADENGVLWMSGVFHFENRSLGAGITMGLGDGYINNRGRAFQAATTDFIGVNGSTSATAANFRLNAMVTEGGWTAGQFAITAGPVALPTPATTDLIVIMKFTFRGPGLADDVEAAFFTEDTLLADITEANFNSSPSKVTASYATGIDENNLTVLSVTQGRFNNAMDEIRIGTTFSSVVNLPTPGAVDIATSTLSASPTAVAADGVSTSTITVTLTDSLGVPVPGKDVTLANTAGPQQASIIPLTAVTTNATGQASFTVSSNAPGTEVFTATNTTDALEVTQTASVTFVSSADADQSMVVASPIFVDANGTSTATVTVTLKSAEGVPVGGKNVTLAGSPANSVITPASQTSDGSGVATFTVSSTTSGTKVFTATDTTDAVVVTQTASVNFVGPADAGLSTVVASPSSVVANGTTTSTITVSLKDANGFPVSGKNVTLAGSPDNAVIAPLTAVTTNASGLATFTVCSGTIGTVVFTATATEGNLAITDTASVDFVDPAVPYAVNVNFNPFTGANFPPGLSEVESELVGPAGGLGTRWNQFAANSSSGVLLDPNGVGTGIAFTTNFSEGRYDGTGATPMLRSTLTDFAKAQDAPTRTFTITGLVPNEAYDVWLAAFRNQAAAGERIYGRWIANNPTTSASVQYIDNRVGQNGTTFVEGYNYIVFTGVTANETGQISFTGDAMGTAEGADAEYRQGLSGFQIAPAAGPPPPTTTLVIDLGEGTEILGGQYIGTGPVNLPLPELPVGSILRSIEMNVALEATDNDNFASDLSLLLDPTPLAPGGDFSVEITNGTSPFLATVSLDWPAAADAGPGTSLVDTKTAAAWATVAPIDLATTGLFLGNAFGSAPAGGTWSGTITLTYDLVGAETPYQGWAGDAAFADDKNGDGVDNGIAFLLGADNPDDNANGLLPAASNDGSGLVLEFSMLNADNRGDAKLTLQWSSDLGVTDLWENNVALVPDVDGTVNGVIFDITEGDPLNGVKATIPSSEGSGGKLFGRLVGAEN